MQVGDAAPDFALPAVTRDGDRTIRLSDYAGRKVVLYFYPKDDTPGCTSEACGFRDVYAAFEEQGAAILGISPDTAASHAKFAGKYSLPFPLLADDDKTVCQAYGVWKEKRNYGRTYLGVERTTFLIDESGRVARIWPKVKVDGHVDAVLSAVRAGGTC